MKINILFKDSYRTAWSHYFGLVKAAKRLGYELSDDADILIVSAPEKFSGEEILAQKSKIKVGIALESISTPKVVKNYTRKLKLFDLIFVNDEKAIPGLYKLGAKKVLWLPFSVDERMFKPLDLEKKWDYSFYGHVYYERREFHQKIAGLPKTFPMTTKSSKEETTKRLVRHINQTAINFNYPSLNQGITNRVFEVLACGGFLLQPDYYILFPSWGKSGKIDQDFLFEDKKHFVIYRSPEEAVELAKYYLAHPEEREKIAMAGRKEVLEKHTTIIRFQQIINAIEESL